VVNRADIVAVSERRIEMSAKEIVLDSVRNMADDLTMEEIVEANGFYPSTLKTHFALSSNRRKTCSTHKN
jgi:hypothetical protein